MQIMSEQKKLRTVKDVAEELGVHQSTVRKWVREGTIASFRLPHNRYKIEQSELDRLLREAHTKPESENTDETKNIPE